MHRSCALIIRDQKLLLITHVGGENWYTPGGRSELDETPLQTMQRELQEELGSRLPTSLYTGIVPKLLEDALVI